MKNDFYDKNSFSGPAQCLGRALINVILSKKAAVFQKVVFPTHTTNTPLLLQRNKVKIKKIVGGGVLECNWPQTPWQRRNSRVKIKYISLQRKLAHTPPPSLQFFRP